MRRQKARCFCCGERAVIEKTVWKDDRFADVYYRCKRLECGHTWVMNLTYSHTLTPSGLENGVLKLLIERMRPEEKQMALELLQALGYQSKENPQLLHGGFVMFMTANRVPFRPLPWQPIDGGLLPRRGSLLFTL